MRVPSLLLLVTLMACSAPKGGKGSASSHDDAPFALDEFQSALFIGLADDDYEWGEGYLVLSTEELSCDDLDDEGYYNVLFDPVGSGLFYYLMWENERPERENLYVGFEGLYMGGYSYSDELEAGRASGVIVFHEGYYYVLSGFYSAGSWLRLDRVTEGTVNGDFNTEYWTGSFKAENCGVEEESDDDDDDRDYDSGYEY